MSEDTRKEKRPEKPEKPADNKPVDTKPVTTARANHEKFFFNLIMDLVDFELGYFHAQESYRKMLLERGLKLNIDDAISQVDLFNNRVEKLFIAKCVSGHLGMHHEYDEILRAEIALVTRTTQPPRQLAPPLVPVGDRRDD